MVSLVEFQKLLQCIKKTVICNGQHVRKPSEGSVCSVMFKDISGGGETDAQTTSLYLSHESATITIGYGDQFIDRVIEYCICTMNPEEESQFVVGSTLNVQFTATLSECFFKPYLFQMSDGEKLAMASIFKDQGTVLYKGHKVQEAFVKFHKSLQYLLLMISYYYLKEDVPDKRELNESIELIINLYNNMALCQLTYRNYQHVIDLCTKSIETKPTVKAYFRRALALIEQLNFEKAEADLTRALALDVNNKTVHEKLKFVRGLDKSNQDNYKQTIKQMFN